MNFVTIVAIAITFAGVLGVWRFVWFMLYELK